MSVAVYISAVDTDFFAAAAVDYKYGYRLVAIAAPDKDRRESTTFRIARLNALAS